MVHAFIPQAFHSDVLYLTNFPPQAEIEGGSVPPQNSMIFNNTGEIMIFNNTGEIMEYN